MRTKLIKKVPETMSADHLSMTHHEQFTLNLIMVVVALISRNTVTSLVVMCHNEDPSTNNY